MFNLNKTNVLFILFLLLICLCEAKLTEKSGDPSLKKIQNKNSDIYIGISEKSTDLQSAFNSAVSHAQSQIIQNLSTQAKISILVNEYSFNSDQNNRQEMSIIKQSQYSGLFRINLKADAVYWEKHQEHGESWYIAWVRVAFSKKQYIQTLETEFIRQIAQMNEVIQETRFQETALKTFVLQMIKLKKSLYEFETENAQFKSLISTEIAERYQQHYVTFESLWTEMCRDLSIRFINSDERFPKQVYIHIRYQNHDLKDINLYVKSNSTQILRTDEAGLLVINPNYSHFIRQDYQISLVPESEIYKELPSLKFTLHSPLFNENIRLLVDIKAELPNEDLYQEISQAIRSKGFQLQSAELKNSQPADFMIHIQVQTKYLPKMTKASQHFYDTKIEITLSAVASGQTIKKWDYPDSQYPVIRSTGTSRLSAQSHAVCLKGLANRQELWMSLIQETEQLIKQKKW